MCIEFQHLRISTCHKRPGLLTLVFWRTAKMTRNWKTRLTLTFTGKITFAFSALALGLWPWPCMSLALALAYWPWPWHTCGLVNIPVCVFTELPSSFFLLYWLLFICFLFLLTTLHVYFLTYLSISSRIDPYHFQTKGSRRRPNLVIYFLCVVVYFKQTAKDGDAVRHFKTM